MIKPRTSIKKHIDFDKSKCSNGEVERSTKMSCPEKSLKRTKPICMLAFLEALMAFSFIRNNAVKVNGD